MQALARLQASHDYQPDNSFQRYLPSAPQAQVVPGFGGAGPSPLDYVFEPT